MRLLIYCFYLVLLPFGAMAQGPYAVGNNSAFAFCGAGGSAEACEVILDFNSAGKLPVVNLVNDDDCPDDGDPTLECNPTLMPVPEGKFAAIVTLSGRGYSFRWADDTLSELASDFAHDFSNRRNGSVANMAKEWDQWERYHDSYADMHLHISQTTPWVTQELNRGSADHLSFIILRQEL